MVGSVDNNGSVTNISQNQGILTCLVWGLHVYFKSDCNNWFDVSEWIYILGWSSIVGLKWIAIKPCSYCWQSCSQSQEWKRVSEELVVRYSLYMGFAATNVLYLSCETWTFWLNESAIWTQHSSYPKVQQSMYMWWCSSWFRIKLKSNSTDFLYNHVQKSKLKFIIHLICKSPWK